MTAAPAPKSNEEHALLSASGSHKWLHCPPSARLEEQIPETESVYANEGRLAHSIGELKLRKAFIEPMGPKKFNAALKKLQADPLYQNEMLHYTDVYLDYISGIVHSFASPPYVAVEKRLNYSAYAPEGFGTGDNIIIGGDLLQITDLKYGKGVPVSAENNPQMMLYALGAYHAYSILYGITRVKMAVIQPRLDSISEWEITAQDLLAWGESIKPIAQMAHQGLGENIPGEWCRFCRAKAQCRARADSYSALADFGKPLPPLINNDEVGRLLTIAQGLKSWLGDLEEYALAECLKGNEVQGWKAVPGRSNRTFDNTDEAFKVLTDNGYEEALLYERKPIILTQVETLLGKPAFATLLNSHVVKPDGKPTLAPLTDKREAISNRTTAAEDFANWTSDCE